MKTEWIIEFNFRCQSDGRECKRQAGIWLYVFKVSMGPCCLSSQSPEAWPSQQETWSWTTQEECDDRGWGQPEPTGSHSAAAEAQLAGVLSFSLVYFAHPTCLPGGQGAEAGGGLPVKAAQVSKVLKGYLLPLAVSFCCFFVFFQEVNAGVYFRL